MMKEACHSMRMLRSHRGFVFWLTGLPCSGKTTLARALKDELARLSVRSDVLDGDEVRRDLSPELGYSPEDRKVNVRRVGYLARLLARNGVVSLVAVISPHRETRNQLRVDCEREGIPFLEAYITAERETLIARDVKGMYRKALRGEIQGFTGISAAYEEPLTPEVVVHSDRETCAASCRRMLEELRRRELLINADCVGE